MTREEWEARLSGRGNPLGALLIVYFGQDWADDFGEPWTNVVSAFATKRGGDAVDAVASELDQLIADGLSDADLEWLLHEGVHSAVDWDRFGYPTWHAWLQAVRDELARL